MRDGDISQFLAKVESANLDPFEIYAFSCTMIEADGRRVVYGSVFYGGRTFPTPTNPLPPFQVVVGAQPVPFAEREHVTLQEYVRIMRGESALPHGSYRCKPCLKLLIQQQVILADNDICHVGSDEYIRKALHNLMQGKKAA